MRAGDFTGFNRVSLSKYFKPLVDGNGRYFLRLVELLRAGSINKNLSKDYLHIQRKKMSSETTIILSPLISSAAGAVMGALAAYLLASRNEQKKDNRRNHSGLLSAQYALVSEWNIIKGIQKDLLDPLRDDPLRHYKMPIFYPPGQPLKVPFNRLGFLSQSDDPNLLQQIHIAEQNYESVIQTLNQLVESIERLQTRSQIIGDGFNSEDGAARVSADVRDVFFLKQWTNTLYEVTDKAIPVIEKEIESITKFSKANFKEMKALKLEPLDKMRKAPDKIDFSTDYSIMKWLRSLLANNKK